MLPEFKEIGDGDRSGEKEELPLILEADALKMGITVVVLVVASPPPLWEARRFGEGVRRWAAGEMLGRREWVVVFVGLPTTPFILGWFEDCMFKI